MLSVEAVGVDVDVRRFAAKAESQLTFKAQGRPECGSVVAVSMVCGVPLLLLPFAALLFCSYHRIKSKLDRACS